MSEELRIPIFAGFDYTQPPIGYVVLNHDVDQELIATKMGLTPSYSVEYEDGLVSSVSLTGFGLVPRSQIAKENSIDG